MLTYEMLSVVRTGLAQKLVQMKVFPVIVIAAAGFILTIPAVIYGIPFFSDDGVTHHAIWYTHFSEQLWAGDLYPRWLMGMNEGLGSPLFFYYPPLPYFLTSLLKPFFPGDPHGWHQLGLSASLALTASGLFSYLWLKDMTDRKSALVASVLYMATPYHLASDLYIRGAFAEYWAFVWMPLVLYFSHRIVNRHRMAVVGLAVSYALLAMTHLPTTLIFSPLPICYAFFTAQRSRKVRTAGMTFGAMALGVGLAAVYLWPAMTTQQFVFLDRMTTGYFSYENWLFFSRFNLWRDEKLLLLLLLLDLVAIACCAFIVTRSNPNKSISKINSFWFAAAIASTLMMTQLSKPFWLILPIVQKIQFPWRFNAILSVATTSLLALSISSLRRNNSLSTRITMVIAVLLIAGWIPATGWGIAKSYAIGSHSQAEIDYKNREVEQSREVPEYYPRWNKSMAEINWEESTQEGVWDRLINSKMESLLERAGRSKGNLSKVKIVEGTGRVNVNSWKTGKISLQVETATGMKLDVSHFYYPNWKAHLKGESAGLDVQASQPDGLISLSLPSGNHQVLLELERSKAEKIGEIVSLVSILIALVYVVASKLQRNVSLVRALAETTNRRS